MADKEGLGREEKRTLATFADYQRTFKTESGRRVLRHLMKMYFMNGSTFVPGDPYGTAFNEGARGVIVTLLQKMKVDLRALEHEMTKSAEEAENEEFVV